MPRLWPVAKKKIERRKGQVKEVGESAGLHYESSVSVLLEGGALGKINALSYYRAS